MNGEFKQEKQYKKVKPLLTKKKLPIYNLYQFISSLVSMVSLYHRNLKKINKMGVVVRNKGQQTMGNRRNPKVNSADVLFILKLEY